MITSNMARTGYPSRVVMLAGSESSKHTGLLMDSVIVTDNLATIEVSEIDQIIGTIPTMEKIDEALRATLGL